MSSSSVPVFCHRGLKVALATLFAVAALNGATPLRAQSSPAQSQWNGVERVIAFADVHGAFTELRTLLRESGIIDALDHWAAGRTHVVSLGDLLDRGADSRQVMDLLMRLQAEAQAAGGQLHVLMGNHEAMNLLGDLRYVDAGEYAAYGDLESANERTELRKTWETANGPGATFEQKFPPGYFGHRAAFSPGGKYGQWLLSLPVAIVIDNTLFMHAGPSTAVQGMSLQELNLRYRTALTDFLGLSAQLAHATLVRAGDDYAALPQLARDRLAARATVASGAPDAALSDVVRRFEIATNHTLLSDVGPNWYRGAALCNEASETDVLLPLLQQFGARRLVVGHTPTHDSRVVTRFDGRVIKLDTGMNAAVYKGRAAALIIEPSGVSVHYAGEASASAPKPEGLYVAPDELVDATVLEALRDGTVTVTSPRGPNELNVSVSFAGKRIPAVFQVRSESAIQKEIAAFRLDRQLALGLVPATVAREVQGQRGVLQARPQKWLTQVEMQQSLRGNGWCSWAPQYQLMSVFDTLIGNESRADQSLLFDSTDWLLYLTSHARAFGKYINQPGSRGKAPTILDAEIHRRLQSLSEKNLRSTLGELIDARGRKAILQRRDTLLKLPAAALAP